METPLDNNHIYNQTAKKMAQGDESAATLIFDAFSKPFYRYFAARTGRREDAEDLTQEVFVKIIKHIETFNESKGNFSAWAWQIAKNTMRDHYALGKKEISVAEFYGAAAWENPSFAKAHTEAGMISRILATFPAADQELFSLRHEAGLSYKDMQSITGKATGTLRTAMSRLYAKIRNAYETRPSP